MERLVHESRTGIRIHQHFHTGFDFLVVTACKSFHHDAHRPNHIVTDMRPADAFARRPFKEIRIVLAPYQLAGILIHRVVHWHVTQIRHGQQVGHIGIVHEQTVAKTVHLESIHLSVTGMIVYGVFLQGGLHFIRQFTAFFGQRLFMVHLGQYLGSLTQGSHGKEIGRHQKLKRGGIVGGAES